MSEIRKTKYFVAQTRVQSALGIPDPVNAWFWQGQGFRGELFAQHDDDITPNVPLPNMYKQDAVFTRKTFRQIYDEFFGPGGIPEKKLERVTMETGTVSGTSVLFIDLNEG